MAYAEDLLCLWSKSPREDVDLSAQPPVSLENWLALEETISRRKGSLLIRLSIKRLEGAGDSHALLTSQSPLKLARWPFSTPQTDKMGTEAHYFAEARYVFEELNYRRYGGNVMLNLPSENQQNVWVLSASFPSAVIYKGRTRTDLDIHD